MCACVRGRVDGWGGGAAGSVPRGKKQWPVELEGMGVVKRGGVHIGNGKNGMGGVKGGGLKGSNGWWVGWRAGGEKGVSTKRGSAGFFIRGNVAQRRLALIW